MNLSKVDTPKNLGLSFKTDVCTRQISKPGVERTEVTP